MRAAAKPILDFSESNPTRVGFGSPSLERFLDRANLVYEPDPRGLLRAREALAIDYASGCGSLSPRPDDLFLCASTSEAYGWLFKLLCDSGDAVLVPKPGYPLFDYLAGLEAVEARPYRLDYTHPLGWRIDLDSVREGLDAGRVRAIVLINPNNPTGSYVRNDERKAMIELCARYGCAIIADEVFFGFPVEGGDAEACRASSFAGEEGALCFVLDGLSKKLGLPQMKLDRGLRPRGRARGSGGQARDPGGRLSLGRGSGHERPSFPVGRIGGLCEAVPRPPGRQSRLSAQAARRPWVAAPSASLRRRLDGDCGIAEVPARGGACSGTASRRGSLVASGLFFRY
jgi:hypothetical protein